MDFNASFKQCPKGHWYDPSKSNICPQCAEEERDGLSGGFKNYGPTEYSPADSASFSGGIGVTQPITDSDFDAFPSTTPAGNIEDLNFDEPNENVTAPVYESDIFGFLPVTGWLVCIDGPDKGRDYKIHNGYNGVGRSKDMDIRVEGDDKISREDAALIAYDPDDLKFYLAPGKGKNLIKLNGKTLMMASELHPYDTITIGKSLFKFIPFCGEEFTWNNEN